MIWLFFLLSPLVITLSGCGGGVAGEGTNSYAQTQGTAIIRPSSFIEQGWSMMEKGQYDSAIAKFNMCLSDASNQDERIEAYNGLGWARTRLGSLYDGISWFQKAAGHSKADLKAGYELLFKDLGKGNPHFNYAPRRPTGVTNAECHALLAYACAGLGKLEEAADQIEYAKELNPNYAGTTIDQINRVIDFMNR
jgi:tetratricopeptide (TPR) repeat protein